MTKKLILAIPHSHTWFWTQTAVASLHRNPPKADGIECEIVVVDNSNWSPAIRGITDTTLGLGVTVMENSKACPFHASALDDVIERHDFDYLMAWETDVCALSQDWLSFFTEQMVHDDKVWAVGHWHHEQFINPSCTLYRGSVLREMLAWCRREDTNEQRWGEDFRESKPLDPGMLPSINAPFAEKRGWPVGTKLADAPSGQMKGPGWYEPGQALYHWAKAAGYHHRVCETDATSTRYPSKEGLPTGTFYGDITLKPDFDPSNIDELWDRAATVHLWGGTRALDIIKHAVNDHFVASNTPFWLKREARFWLATVPEQVRTETLKLIKQYRWHYKGQGTPDVTDRDRAAATFIEGYYREGGVQFI